MKTKKKPVISVIMSVYNQKNVTYLDEAITSILKQSFTDFEFIIYNDGSDEGIFARLEEYARKDERIVLINNPVNQGLAYSLNACIDVARGKYLARMDDDDICGLQRFRIQYDYLESHPEIAFVGCNAALIDENGVWGHRKMPQDPDGKNFLKFSPFIHPSVMIRRLVLEGENTYNTSRQTLRCEDYELYMRLNRTGFRGHNIQQEIFSYREDYHSYRKRKLRHRISEMRVRYVNFKEMGLLTPLRYLYVIRPLVSAAAPPGFILYMKRCYHKLRLVAAMAADSKRYYHKLKLVVAMAAESKRRSIRNMEYSRYEKPGIPIIPLSQNPK